VGLDASEFRSYYPGRLTREQWLRLSVVQRCLLVARAQSDLLELWRSCNKKPCRRAHACHGDERCEPELLEEDLRNPNRGNPDFEFSYHFPDALRTPSAILDRLPYLRKRDHGRMRRAGHGGATGLAQDFWHGSPTPHAANKAPAATMRRRDNALETAGTEPTKLQI
jgi:hypothetical protein